MPLTHRVGCGWFQGQQQGWCAVRSQNTAGERHLRAIGIPSTGVWFYNFVSTLVKPGFTTTAGPQYRSLSKNLMQLISKFSPIITVPAQRSDHRASHIQAFSALYCLYFPHLKIFHLYDFSEFCFQGISLRLCCKVCQDLLGHWVQVKTDKEHKSLKLKGYIIISITANLHFLHVSVFDSTLRVGIWIKLLLSPQRLGKVEPDKMGITESQASCRTLLLSFLENKSIQLRNPETTGQMKRKDNSSREKCPEKRNQLAKWYYPPSSRLFCLLQTQVANGLQVTSIQLNTKAGFGVGVWVSPSLNPHMHVKGNSKSPSHIRRTAWYGAEKNRL